MNSRFLAVAQDPAIIPAVRHYCDDALVSLRTIANERKIAELICTL